MSRFSIILIIIFAVAAVLVVAGIIIYNRHLDKVARGEEHDTHSSIPEPTATVGAVYRTVLMVLVVILFFTVSTMSSKVTNLQNTLNNLQSSHNAMRSEIQYLTEQLEESRKNVASASWQIKKTDLSAHTADVTYTVSLKEYTADTKVSLSLTADSFDTKVFPLEPASGGTFRGTFPLYLFSFYDNALVTMDNDGSITAEPVEFPEYVFWDLFPMPAYNSHFESGMRLGKLEYSGAFTIVADHLDRIEKVMLSYLTGNEVLKTMDVTKEVLNETEITLEQGLDLKDDLTFLVEVTTKDGFRVVQQITMIYNSSPGSSGSASEEFLRIYGPDGENLWDDPKWHE